MDLSGVKLTIEYVIEEDSLTDLLNDVVRAIAPENEFFRYGDAFVRLRDGKLTYITRGNLNGQLLDFLEIHFKHGKNDGPAKTIRIGLLTAEQVSTFLENPTILARFPQIKTFTQSPVFDLNCNLIGKPGFHVESGIYYAGPEIVPVEGTQLLEETFSEFCWKSPADRVNYFGILLTHITMPHWIDSCHWGAVFNGDGFDEGSGTGKGMLVKSASYIFEGKPANAISCERGGEEFERKMSAAILNGTRIVVIDNIKTRSGEFENATLEKNITSPVITFRLVGSSKAFSKPNDIMFLLTMNQTKISRDLRRRLVPINLYCEEDPRKRRFKIPKLEKHILANRVQLLGEIAGMVIKWIKQGKPTLPDSPGHSMGNALAAMVDAILKVNGFEGFLSNCDESNESFDCDRDIVESMCITFVPESAMKSGNYKPSQWLHTIEKRDPHLLKIDRFINKSERSKQTILGNIFHKYAGKTIDVDGRQFKVVAEPRGHKNSILYGFVVIGKPSNHGQPENS